MGLLPHTLEVIDDLGVLPGFGAHTSLYPPLGLHLGPLTLPVRIYRRHRVSEDIPHPNTLLAAQHATDGALRRRPEELGTEAEFSARLTTFEQVPTRCHPDSVAGKGITGRGTVPGRRGRRFQHGASRQWDLFRRLGYTIRSS